MTTKFIDPYQDEEPAEKPVEKAKEQEIKWGDDILAHTAGAGDPGEAESGLVSINLPPNPAYIDTTIPEAIDAPPMRKEIEPPGENFERKKGQWRSRNTPLKDGRERPKHKIFSISMDTERHSDLLDAIEDVKDIKICSTGKAMKELMYLGMQQMRKMQKEGTYGRTISDML